MDIFTRAEKRLITRSIINSLTETPKAWRHLVGFFRSATASLCRGGWTVGPDGTISYGNYRFKPSWLTRRRLRRHVRQHLREAEKFTTVNDLLVALKEVTFPTCGAHRPIKPGIVSLGDRCTKPFGHTEPGGPVHACRDEDNGRYVTWTEKGDVDARV